jgi:acyl-coenzyme A synthetase/AMP-(fatty) acid ligase
MVDHKGMLNHLFAKIEDLNLTESDIVAQTASQCFDISVWQMLAALLVGGQVQVVETEITHDPAGLLNRVEQESITVLEVVPSLLRAMLEEVEAGQHARWDMKRLRWMIATGEALPPDLANRWLSLFPQIPLLNAYGPTECSDDVTHHCMRDYVSCDQTRVPIGRPISNMNIYVLDPALSPKPTGIPGELCVGGVGVGRGYVNDGERTAERFIPDPFSKVAGARLYRTGDLARFLPDGTLDFLGRIDHQVKLRGFRIELGEIEHALSEYPTVRHSVVMIREDSQGDKTLAAYVVAEPGHLLMGDDLRKFLADRLPEYMVPSEVAMLEELPLTPNGKLDRGALLNITAPRLQFEDDYAAPHTPTEKAMAGIWEMVTGKQRVGIREKFFDIGGDSLKLVRVFRLLNELYPNSVTIVDLFKHNTIESLSLFIDHRCNANISTPAIQAFEI